MDCANLNGFNPTTTGCQIIIGDGLRGTDDVTVPVKNGEYVKEAKIGRAIMGTDALATVLGNHPVRATFLAALVGLIPNCGASVAITELYLDGVLSTGPMRRPAIVIVTFKRQKLLAGLFDSIERLTVAPWRVVVVDNEDSEQTAHVVQEFSGRVHALVVVGTKV